MLRSFTPTFVAVPIHVIFPKSPALFFSVRSSTIRPVIVFPFPSRKPANILSSVAPPSYHLYTPIGFHLCADRSISFSNLKYASLYTVTLSSTSFAILASCAPSSIRYGSASVPLPPAKSVAALSRHAVSGTPSSAITGIRMNNTAIKQMSIAPAYLIFSFIPNTFLYCNLFEYIRKNTYNPILSAKTAFFNLSGSSG